MIRALLRATWHERVRGHEIRDERVTGRTTTEIIACLTCDVVFYRREWVEEHRTWRVGQWKDAGGVNGWVAQCTCRWETRAQVNPTEARILIIEHAEAQAKANRQAST